MKLLRIGCLLVICTALAAGGVEVVDDESVAIDPHRTRGRIHNPADDADQRRLPRAIRSEKAENLARTVLATRVSALAMMIEARVSDTVFGT